MPVRRLLRDLPIYLLIAIAYCGFLIWSNFNYIDVNLRSEISGVRVKLRDTSQAIAQALQAKGHFPFAVAEGGSSTLMHLPLEFTQKVRLTSGDGKPTDWFQDHQGTFYFAQARKGVWMLASPGPDRTLELTTATLKGWAALDETEIRHRLASLNYDPSNGTRSGGDIIRMGETSLR